MAVSVNEPNKSFFFYLARLTGCIFLFLSLSHVGRDANRCAIPHGKALGGSSVIYFLMHTRGNPNDFDRWAEAGNYGWSYHEVLPYFIKSERANIGKYSDSPFHNKNGLWGVSFNAERTPLVKAFIKANKIMGLPEIDYNSDHQLGVSYVQSNTLNGRRHSAYKAFLEPILHRPNLHIMVNKCCCYCFFLKKTSKKFLSEKSL